MHDNILPGQLYIKKNYKKKTEIEKMTQDESHKHSHVDWETEQLGSSMDNVYARGVLELLQRESTKIYSTSVFPLNTHAHSWVSEPSN